MNKTKAATLPFHAAPSGASEASAGTTGATTGRLGTNIRWQKIDLLDQEVSAPIKALLARICREDERATLEADLDWASGACANSPDRAFVWVCTSGGEPVGFAPLMATRSKLNLDLGNFTLWSWPIERFTLVGGPLFLRQVRDQEDRLTSGLLEDLRRTMPARSVLFVLGCRADAALFQILSAREAAVPFLVAPHGAAYDRRLVRLPESFDGYVAGLSKKTRENVRRLERKAPSAPSGPFGVRRFVAPEEVEPFLDTAIDISQKTYQWQKLSLGLRDRPALTRHLSAAAKCGQMLCYLLYHEDVPIAFQVGYRFKDTYYTHDTGYDPAWRDYSPGNKLDLVILKDLIEQEPEVHWVDFLYGDSFNKARFSNAERRERHFYLFAPTLWGCSVFASLTTTNWVSETLGRLLDRFGVKELLRRRLWR